MEQIDARSLSPKAQERLRQLAVQAVLDGQKQGEAAKLFGVTRRAVSKWLKAYRTEGLQALTAKAQGRPKGGALLPWQAAQIAKTVIDHHPEQLKLPFYLMDPRSGDQIDPAEVWYQGVFVDYRPLFKALGFYSAKASTPGPGAESPRGGPLAGKRMPRHSTASQERKGSDLLG